MNAVRIGLQVLLAVVFLGAGLAKLTRQPALVDSFRRMRLSDTVMRVAGATEVVAGLALLVALGIDALVLTAVVAGALVVQMLVAAAAETRDGSPAKVLPPVVLAGLAAALGVLALSA